MSQAPKLHQVEEDVRTTRHQFVSAMQQFMLSLPFTGTNLLAKHLLSHAEEFGVAHTLKLSTADPSHFGLSAPLTNQSAKLLHELHDASTSLDLVVRLREELLLAENPAHDRRYSLQGREFTMDFKQQKITYQDTLETEPLDPALCRLEAKIPVRTRRNNRSL